MENQTNSNAVVALVLGILSLFIPVIGFILAIIGIVLAVKARKTIRLTNEAGNGLAIAGLICSIVSLVFYLLAIIAFIGFFLLASVSTY